MAITLEQAKVGMADKIDQTIIDMFRRDSFLLSRLTFDNCVSPGTGGTTMMYGYTRLLTPTTAEGRAINNEYTPGEAIRTNESTALKIFGGAFTIDRVLEETSAKSEVAFQFAQKEKATVNKIHYMVINGKAQKIGSKVKAGDGSDFDGLNEMLKGASTEHIPTASIDLSTLENIKANASAFDYELSMWLKTLSEKPEVLFVNSKMAVILSKVAKELGFYTRDKNAFGEDAEYYNGILIEDLGEYYDGSKQQTCVQIDKDGETCIYAARMGLDALHGASPNGDKLIRTYKPDFKTPGAVKRGELEIIMGLVLKDTTKCGVFRKIKVQAAASASA